jgi:hypothetical protein
MQRVAIAEMLWAREAELQRRLAALRAWPLTNAAEIDRAARALAGLQRLFFWMGLDKRGSLIADEAPGSHRKPHPNRWGRLSEKAQPVAIFPTAFVADENIGYQQRVAAGRRGR